MLVVESIRATRRWEGWLKAEKGGRKGGCKKNAEMRRRVQREGEKLGDGLGWRERKGERGSREQRRRTLRIRTYSLRSNSIFGILNFDAKRFCSFKFKCLLFQL